MTRLGAGVTEGYPSATPTPYPSPMKGAPVTPPPATNVFSANLFSTFSSNFSTSPPVHAYSSTSHPTSRKRPREEEVDTDIKLRTQTTRYPASNSTDDDDSDSDDDLDIITCSSDSDKAHDRPIRPLRKTSYASRALPGLSVLNAGSFNSADGEGFYTVPPISKDIQTEDEIMTILD